MKGILTPEEKKYLRFISNYLQSVGLKRGYIDIEMEYDDEDLPSVEKVNWKYLTHFSNNYSLEVPDELTKIFKKVLSHLNEIANINTDYDGINNQRLEISVDAINKQISATHELSYYGRGEEHSIEYDSTEDKEKFDKWMETSLSETTVPSDGILDVTYNGGGDSGWIEDSFRPTNDKVPAEIEDFMYQELERHFGGWEINEGSDGRFIFNFNNSTVELSHTYNTEEYETDTLYEESFVN